MSDPRTVTERIEFERDGTQRRTHQFFATVQQTLEAIEMLVRQGAQGIHVSAHREAEDGRAFVELTGYTTGAME